MKQNRSFLAAWSAFSLMLPPAAAQPLAEALLPRFAVYGPPFLKAPQPKTLKGMLELPRPSFEEEGLLRLVLSRYEQSLRYDAIIVAYAQRHNLDARLIKAIIAAESQFNPQARSPRGARGLMQLMPATAEEFGVSGKELTDPERNIAAGSAYLEVLFQMAWARYHLQGVRAQDAPVWLIRRIIAAYNAGPRALKHNRWRFQTVDYVRKVLVFYRSEVTEVHPFRPGQVSCCRIPADLLY